ncbi:Phenylalanine aminomutase (L-beta-phenylalanine forming) [Lachnellula arida]|uniref:Phenylalanine aminomutase (L-beta-phenylalanine forming) n=1 Tax=Lachnellula arida TaxID=1316785 RepID=A0A8T9B9F3_9HELO|nr:Phenylalanine aminomutase (L-beta-phenylalanine forming) [Lachnellula arida]
MPTKYRFEPLVDDGSDNGPLYPSPPVGPKTSVKVLLLAVLATSIAFNVLQILFGVQPLNMARFANAECRSQYVNLQEKEVEVKWLQQSKYTNPNAFERDREWDRINYDTGIVAVPKPWALQKGLALGVDFPWDTSKSVYFVNAFHSLHCLKYIYKSLMEYREGMPQTSGESHILHCLDQLRADVECSADDTLRWATPDRSKSTAVGQTRQCRSFDELKAWTIAYPGCYRFGNATFEDAQDSQVPRKRYCPEGSPELDVVRSYFGKGSDWTPANDPVWSWFDGE